MQNHRAKPSFFLYLFLVALLIDIILIECALSEWRIFSKGTLMPLLILHIIFAADYTHIRIKQSHLVALIFSFIGDIVLQLGYFIPGLISFLCAHLAYIYLFYWYKVFRVGILSGIVILLMVIPAYFLGSWLTTASPDMQIPVTLYAFVILNMAVAVVRVFPRSSYLLSGALLFIISDFILSLGLFKEPLPHQSSLVMLTYGLAQLGLLIGILRHEMKYLSV